MAAPNRLKLSGLVEAMCKIVLRVRGGIMTHGSDSLKGYEGGVKD